MQRDILIAAGIGVALVTLWSVASSFGAPPAPPPPVALAPVAVEAPQALPVAMALKDGKLRASASIYGDVIGRIKRDAMVQVLEVKGDWTRIRRTGELAKAEVPEGWAKSALLQEIPEEPAAPLKPE